MIQMTLRRLILTVLFCSAPALLAQQGSTDIAVVVNPSNPVSNMTVNELHKIFMADRLYWNSKTPVLVILHRPDTPETHVLLTRIVKMSESDYKSHWDAKVFRGEVSAPPPVVYSNGMATEGVVSIPGGISLVSARDVRGKGKVIKVDGLLPGQPGYPLHP